ncbi:hypothetical protein [Phocaeicola oris]|uniref:hypothetical protein n=1 Tax=Phocaeicola oris TaxID=2896850 RepID=UPI00234EE8ED|nr:hypothetical protein [Phocaeicola oris]MCE2616080.1 hypothetical protein [Phocaeicola oris]
MAITYIIVIAVILFYFLLSLGNNSKQRELKRKQYVGKLLQLLETAYILHNTTKFETFKSRINFLSKLLPELLPPTDKDYIEFANQAEQEYKSRYPDRHLSQRQIEVIGNPKCITQESLMICYVDFFKRYCLDLENQILKLKTSTAKQKRINQVANTAKIIIAALSVNNGGKFANSVSQTESLFYDKYGKPNNAAHIIIEITKKE